MNSVAPRVALLSMDIEDWYHLEYFHLDHKPAQSMLDGVARFRDVLALEEVPATFFTLGGMADCMGPALRTLIDAGHEVASHGPDHRLLTGRSVSEFAHELKVDKARLENVTGHEIRGYRAPCFSMDRSKLDCLIDLGFRYDSSWIRFQNHPLYGSFDLDDWAQVAPRIWRAPGTDFLEFEVPTITHFGKRLPVGGGAYFRAFPWLLTKMLLKPLLDAGGAYVFYIHPFECSDQALTEFPPGVSRATRLRFQIGRGATLGRLRSLIKLLRESGYLFQTFRACEQFASP